MVRLRAPPPDQWESYEAWDTHLGAMHSQYRIECQIRSLAPSTLQGPNLTVDGAKASTRPSKIQSFAPSLPV